MSRIFDATGKTADFVGRVQESRVMNSHGVYIHIYIHIYIYIYVQIYMYTRI